MEQAVAQLAPYSQPEIRDRQERLLAKTITTKCAEALGPIAEAIQRPIISRSDIERAQVLLDEAHAAAAILDPAEEEEQLHLPGAERPFTRSHRDLNDDVNRIAKTLMVGEGFDEARARFKRRWGV